MAVFGILLILAGVLCLLLAAAYLVLPLVSVGASAPPVAWPAAAAGSFLYGLAGVLLIWTGVGSLRLRRWVRPILLILAWTWLIAGLFAVLLVALIVDDLMILATRNAGAPSSEVLTAAKVLVLASAVTAGLVFPALLIWIYGDADVRWTLERRDPRPAWTDRCPLSVLGLGVGLALAAVASLPLAVQPAVPWFGQLVTGWRGSVLVLAGGVACAVLARSTLRRQPVGWWATTALLLMLGISSIPTFLRVEPRELYAALGYPEQQLAVLGDTSGAARAFAVGAAVVLTVLSLVYMLLIRRHFTPESSSETRPFPGPPPMG